jgi:hypothetical protein
MTLATRILASALVLAGFSALPAQADSTDRTISCSSRSGDRVECPADLRGYSLADIQQQSRAQCEIGRNFGYDDRGVWVDGGCRGAFTFREGDDRSEDARSFGYTEPGIEGEKRVRCESEGGRRANCDADLHGYRFVEVRNLSRADCIIGRNFGYDDRGVWTAEGCRGEFVFADERAASRYPDDRPPVYSSSNSGGIVRCESNDGRTQVCPADGAERVRLAKQLSRTECVEGRNWGVNRDGIWVDDGCRGDFEVRTRLSSSR